MLPFAALLSLIPLLPYLTLAAPTQEGELSTQHRAGLVLRTLDAIERETRAGRTINFDAVLSPAERDLLGLGGGNAALRERQLIGGGDDYAPYEMPCPDNYDWVRSANGLGNGEQSYLDARSPKVKDANERQLSSLGLPLPPRAPIIGLALSGGGYRAMTVGSGGVAGLNNASSDAQTAKTGGWLDAVTYQAGLSGGSWATGTTVVNNYTLPTDLIKNLWNLESNLIVPDDGKLSFYYDMISNVRAKSNAGFQTQIADYWSLALGDHLLPTQYHLSNSPNYTFTDVLNTVPGINAGELPMPIIVAAEREPGEIVVPANASVYEMTPWEFGSWAFGSTRKVRGAFTPIEYVGSQLDNAQPSGKCFKGFDQMSFVMGTSSSLFSGALAQLTTSNASSIIVDAIQNVLESISQQENDIAAWPNAFKGWNSDNNPISGFDQITLVDAGLTNQNIPIEPLLIPYRQMDAIIAFDSSADTTYSWPNGSALRTTYERAQVLAQTQDVAIGMPEVPSVNGFVNGGFNQRPVFFGCNATATPATGNRTAPILIYVPNYPWSYYGNVSTYQLAYSEDEATAVVLNGEHSLTLNGTVPTWPTCLACALNDRAYTSNGGERSQQCQECFDTWCWDGTDDDSTPQGEYEPVVGTVPQFLSDKGLVDDSAETKTGNSANSAATSEPAASSGAAGRAVGGVGHVGWVGAVSAGVGVIVGALAVLA